MCHDEIETKKWTQHKQDQHNPISLNGICECGTTFDTPQQFFKHMDENHTIILQECLCGKKFFTQEFPTHTLSCPCKYCKFPLTKCKCEENWFHNENPDEETMEEYKEWHSLKKIGSGNHYLDSTSFKKN